MMARFWIVLASLLGASGVSVGAYHAHGLATYLESSGFSPGEIDRKMGNCETAIEYQMFHVFALLAVAMMVTSSRSRWIHLAGVLFLAGILSFSGGLYLFVFADNIVHGAIIPAGGLLLILGWLVLGVSGLVAFRGGRPG